MAAEGCPYCEATATAMCVVGKDDPRFYGGFVDERGIRHDPMRHEDGCLLVFPPKRLYIARHPNLPAPRYLPLIVQGEKVAEGLEEDGWEVVSYARETPTKEKP